MLEKVGNNCPLRRKINARWFVFDDIERVAFLEDLVAPILRVQFKNSVLIITRSRSSIVSDAKLVFDCLILHTFIYERHIYAFVRLLCAFKLIHLIECSMLCPCDNFAVSVKFHIDIVAPFYFSIFNCS